MDNTGTKNLNQLIELNYVIIDQRVFATFEASKRHIFSYNAYVAKRSKEVSNALFKVGKLCITVQHKLLIWQAVLLFIMQNRYLIYHIRNLI